MKALNLYAGIGGNRRLWGNEHEITVVEIKREIKNTELIPQTIDEMNILPFHKRQIALEMRHKWLKRQRMQDKIEHRRIQQKAYVRKYRYCKTHNIVHSNNKNCPHCMKELKKMRRKNE